ncbi:DUF4264 family protein [Clostridium sp. WILCCON 0269]|uniref:DUF4264 family protein n=1 Tax=Candidatus Clostridium eludens TaxID=3381663 RepID=A0ABW8SL88_9CLOT
MKNELKLISSKEFSHYEDMYKIVDFLNKNLNSYGLTFGVHQEDNKDVINIYKNY